MLAEHRNKATGGIVTYFGLVFAAPGLRSVGFPETGPVYLLAFVPLVWGCFHLAVGKGYHGALCLVGLVPLLGVLVLLLIPDRKKKPSSPTGTGEQAACPACGHPYSPADYRPDAGPWLCSRCHEPLQVAGQPGASSG